MAPYDSDSSDDEDAGTQLSYTDTNVLLGYADPEDQDAGDDGDGGNETVSRLGGRPDWLVTDQAPPSAGLARCLVCKALLVLLLQLNGELPDRFPGHERRLYVLACRNKACRRKAGSVRVIRGVRVDAAVANAAEAEKEKKEKKAKAAEAAQSGRPVGTVPGLGNSVFGAANPFSSGSGSGSANPFSLGGSSSPAAGALNPFSIGGAAKASQPPPSSSSTPPTTKPQAAVDDAAKALPKTFAETLSLNNDQADAAAAATAAASPPEPWPAADTWPAAYPVSWIAEAEYETLDPTPAAIPGVVTEAMEVEDGSAGGSGGGKEDKFVFESSMDAAFQKFADRVAQNPDQVIRYEFSGQPLLYNKDDSVAGIWAQPQTGGSISTVLASSSGRLPPCPNCRSRRVFEVQLMPHAIDLLEADELGLEGMDWGTVVVGVCEKDCQAKDTAANEASYLEEWVGVQWEDLEAQRR
ncbi:hypothetical protein SCUCBS95973_003521 [Sporothrix curviconia]|uniref:Programmed cell death protein 2 C-terminal domain-containing protein n=1 Tax=Sporothrix curviconia TaxID=1260050 RepID=A0ABP0BGB5_9PEZI